GPCGPAVPAGGVRRGAWVPPQRRGATARLDAERRSAQRRARHGRRCRGAVGSLRRLAGGGSRLGRRFPCAGEERMNDNQTTPRRGGGSGKVVQLRQRAGTPTTPPARATGMSRLRMLFVIDELDIGGTEQQI